MHEIGAGIECPSDSLEERQAADAHESERLERKNSLVVNPASCIEARDAAFYVLRLIIAHQLCNEDAKLRAKIRYFLLQSLFFGRSRLEESPKRAAYLDKPVNRRNERLRMRHRVYFFSHVL